MMQYWDDIGNKNNNTHLTVLCLDYAGEPVPEMYKQSEFTGAKDSEWQWHHLGHMQICTLPQTDNHTSTPPGNTVEENS